MAGKILAGAAQPIAIIEEQALTGAGKWVAITPSDINPLPAGRPRGIYVGVAGDINMAGEDGNAEVFKDVAVGIHVFRPVQVFATNTTATNIIALY